MHRSSASSASCCCRAATTTRPAAAAAEVLPTATAGEALSTAAAGGELPTAAGKAVALRGATGVSELRRQHCFCFAAGAEGGVAAAAAAELTYTLAQGLLQVESLAAAAAVDFAAIAAASEGAAE